MMINLRFSIQKIHDELMSINRIVNNILLFSPFKLQSYLENYLICHSMNKFVNASVDALSKFS